MPQGINIGEIYADLSINSKELDRGLANARRAINMCERELRQLDAELRNGIITWNDYNTRVAALNNTINDLAQRMQAAYAANNQLNAGLGVANQSLNQNYYQANRAGLALMQLGNIVDDVQYGFKGVVNNIGPLALGLSGGNLSIAAAAQVAAVAIFQLYEHWDEFVGLLGIHPVRTQAEEMELLASKTRKTADEQLRYNKYKKEQQEIDALMAKRPSTEGHEGKAIEEAIVEGDPGKIRRGVIEAMKRQNADFKLNEHERAAIEAEVTAGQVRHDITGGILGTDYGDVNQAIEKKVEEKQRQANERAAGELMTKPDRRKDLKALVAKHPDLFPPGFLEDMEETQQDEDEKDKEFQDQIDKRKQAVQKRDQRRKQVAKERAGELMKGAAGQSALRGDLTQEDVEADLHMGGMQAGAIPKVSGAVFREMQRQAAQQIRERGIEKGISDEDARADILADQDEKRQREEEAARSRAHRRGTEAVPGIDEFAKQAATMGEAMGTNPDVLKKQIRAMLAKAGLNEKDADLGAEDIAEDAQRNVRDKIVKAMFEAPDKEQKATRSEQFDAAQLASKIQGGVSNEDIGKKQLSVQEQIVKQLAEIRKGMANPLDFEVK
jgi:hypothetical protein